MQSLNLVMSECSPSGRGQGRMSNFYNVDLENFATATSQYTGDIHNSTIVDSKASWLSAHVYYTSAHLNPPTSYLRFVQDLSTSWGLSAGYQPRPQVVDRGTTARYGGQLRYI